MKKFGFITHTGFFLGIVALFTTAVMLLWNFLIPGLFGLAAINFWQALGLFALARILFGGFGFGDRMHAGHMHPMRDKWMRMTPEQRKEFIEKRRTYGFGSPFGRGCFGMGNYEKQNGGDE